MKIENTYLNEAKFRALYVGQTVLSHPGNDVLYTLSSDLIFGERDRFLSLRSISSLTDEEYSAVAKMTYGINLNTADWGRYSLLNDIPKGQYRLSSSVADYLRSIGILMPWMDLSVEDLLAYGWAKIKEA